METHFEILIDASGSMGYMTGEENEENKYLLPDGSTRTSLVKKILCESLIDQLSHASIININTFRKYFHLNNNQERIIKTRKVKDSTDKILNQRYYSDYPSFDEIYSGKFLPLLIKEKVKLIQDPEPGGTPLWWALSVKINKIKNKLNLIILSDGDANDKSEFDTEILKLISEKKQDVKIHFIGIAQNEVAQKKSKNLADKTGGIYTNLKALDYDVNALNVLLSKLNTQIVSNALEDNIKHTQTLATTKMVETTKGETENIPLDEDDKSEKQPKAIANKTIDLEKQVNQNTSSLQLICTQLNNIISLLQSKEQLEENVVVIENKIHNERIGKLAEQYLFKKLQELFKDTTTKVSWLNEHGEQGLPYDFLLEKENEKFYYECKGTSSGLLEFQLTKPEWDFYLDNRNKYRLCFVKHVDADAQYTRFMDLLTDMEEKKLTPCSTQNKAYKANRLIFTINESGIKWA